MFTLSRYYQHVECNSSYCIIITTVEPLLNNMTIANYTSPYEIKLFLFLHAQDACKNKNRQNILYLHYYNLQILRLLKCNNAHLHIKCLHSPSLFIK
jgi:hypothetical protein